MSKNLKQSLIFGGGKKLLEVEQELDELDKERDYSEGFQSHGGPWRCSAYVGVFESMVNTVLQHEHTLLSTKEIKILQQFAGLCYNSRYCLTRLVLRKVNQWHPLSSLESYKKEVGGEEGLTVAVHNLCLPLDDELFSQNAVKLEHSDGAELELVKPDISVKAEDGPEIIDLSIEPDEDVNLNVTSLSVPSHTVHSLWSQIARPSVQPQASDSIQTVLHSDRSGIINISSFCENESVMTTREILGRINKDELTGLAKEMKCKIAPKFKKMDIVNCLLQHAVNQRVLDFSPRPLSERPKGKYRDDGEEKQSLNHMFVKQEIFAKPTTTQEVRLRQLAIKRLGPCIRINSEFFCLVRRLHIICFRETEHPTSLLLPALLSTFKKRNYTPYTPNRTDQAWASREDLLEYERALELDKLLDDIMEEEPEALVPKRATGTPAYRRDSFATPTTPIAKGTRIKTPVRTPGSIISCPFTTPGPDLDGGGESVRKEELVQLDKKDKMKAHFINWIYPTWQNYVMDETRRGVRPRPIGLERFDPGHVYTRMVHKATRVFGPLQEFELELETLDALLDQRFWSRGKRARWYTRRALVLKHLAGMERDKAKKRDLHERSLEGIKTALLDDDTGIVHRPGLVKRLLVLENILKIPSDQCSKCAGELRNAPIVELKAVRVHVDPQKTITNEKENTPKLDGYITVVAGKEMETEEEKLVKKTGKSSWKGRDDQVVNVESRALEHYEDQGYKGFHCETRILTTIFGLVFWDIIFADIPGSFETQYQTAPLDLLYDSFYRARKKMIDHRLQELRDGKGRDILRQHDEAYRDRTVVCVGVTWDLCPREDLLEIVDCIGGETLAIICQLFCEDYGGRRSGAPDLFVWHVGERKCKFVEVKGPNDRPQENQKYWFDALLRANADVELCKVIDININSNSSSNKRKKSKTPASVARRKKFVVRIADDFESEEQDYDKLDRDNDRAEGDCLQQQQQPSSKRRKVLPVTPQPWSTAIMAPSTSDTPCPSRTSRTYEPN